MGKSTTTNGNGHGKQGAKDAKGASAAKAAGKPLIDAEPKPPFPEQHLEGTGRESDLEPRPRYSATRYRPSGKLEGKRALITGGDSGIGRAVALIFAREGADVVIGYHSHDGDAEETKSAVEAEGRRCIAIKGDLTDPAHCRELVERTVRELGGLDVLVSNAAFQKRAPSIEAIDDSDFDRTIKTNVYALFHLAKAAVPHLRAGSSIICTGSETGLYGNASLLDYSMTKGAIHTFVKSLASSLAGKSIRVNCVAPGPVWTPLNPADDGADAKKVAEFGSKTELGRPGQPEEIAPAFVFFASDADSSFVTGQILAPLGGAHP